jgi:hypothetical protein
LEIGSREMKNSKSISSLSDSYTGGGVTVLLEVREAPGKTPSVFGGRPLRRPKKTGQIYAAV